MVIRFNLDEGTATMLFTDDLAIKPQDIVKVERASHIEWSPVPGEMWTVYLPDGASKVRAGFEKRSDALAWEKVWAEEML